MPRKTPTAAPAAVFQFSLLDPAGQPNVLVDHELTWKLVNNATGSGQDLVITPFGSGQVGPGQYHFKFDFEPGAFIETPALEGWEVAADRDSNAIKSLYVASATKLSIPPTKACQAILAYTRATQEDPGRSQVAVTLVAGQNVTLAGKSIEGRTFGPIDLDLVQASAAVSAPPIFVDFVGRRTVLNDGETCNSFTFAVTNMTAVDLQLTPDLGAVFTVWFDAAPDDAKPNDYPWALARIQDLKAAGVTLAGPPNWKTEPPGAVPMGVAGNPQWSLTVTQPVTLAPQSPVLFTFSGIKTGLDPGFTRMYLLFENLPGIPRGVLVAELEKSPLLYGAARGQGLYLSAGRPQSGTLPEPTYDQGLYVEQFDGGKPAATFHGGRGVSISLAPTGGGVLWVTADPQKGAVVLEGLSPDGNGTAKMMTLSGRGEENLTNLELRAQTTETFGDLKVGKELGVEGGITAKGLTVSSKEPIVLSLPDNQLKIASDPYRITVEAQAQDGLVLKAQNGVVIAGDLFVTGLLDAAADLNVVGNAYLRKDLYVAGTLHEHWGGHEQGESPAPDEGRSAALQDLVDVLERIVGRPFSTAERQDLVNALGRLV